jgi:hypothetical protein
LPGGLLIPTADPNIADAVPHLTIPPISSKVSG